MNKGILFVAILLLGIISCEPTEDEEPMTPTEDRSQFELGSQTLVASQTSLYQTDDGRIIQITGTDFELDLVLSDLQSTSFTVTSSLTGEDTGKAIVVLRQANQIHFSQSGQVSFSIQDSTGTFEVLFADNVSIDNGLIFNQEIHDEAFVNFTDITRTDFNGNNMNSGDANDWTIQTSWSPVEATVFRQGLTTATLQNFGILMFPNPFTDYFSFQLDIPQNYLADLVMVNANFEVEKTYEALSPQTYSFLLDDAKFKGHYYRLYYKIYSSSMAHYGSGDLLFE